MYESYYGLTSKPFQLTPDPSFFFGSKWHKRAMSYLQYGLSQAEGFIVKTASSKTNKVFRLIDMLYHVVKYRKQTHFVLIDTYSTSNFYYAFLLVSYADF